MKTIVKATEDSVNNQLPTFFDDFFTRDLFQKDRNSTGFFHPKVNILEKDHAYEMSIAAPGMSKKDFNLTIENNSLIVRAHKENESDEINGKFTLKEYNYQSFERSFSLSDGVIDVKGIKAKYNNGVLCVTLPKSKEWKEKSFRRIDVV